MHSSESDIRLGRTDLIRFETLLSGSLGKIVAFTSHSLHFPKSFPEAVRTEDPQYPWTAAYLPEENKLLLPLVHDSEPLAMFIAGGVVLTDPDIELRLITKSVLLCMEHLALYKRSRIDPQTGVANRDTMLQTLEQEIDLILTCIRPGSSVPVDCPIQGYRASFGMILMQVDTLSRINQRHGYALGDSVLDKAGRLIKKHCPEHALAARIGGSTFAILWPQANPRNCRRLCERLRTEFGRQTFTSGYDTEISTHVSLGFVNYPQDMLGWQLRLSPPEQCRSVLDKGRQALTVARREGGDLTYSFRDILSRGGRISRLHPLNRLEIDLGKGTGIQEGHRFLIWPAPAGHSDQAGDSSDTRYPHIPKGEVMVMEVRDEASIAEILHLSDPSWAPSAGDKLTPVTERDKPLGRTEIAPSSGGQGDLPTGLLTFGDFLRRWSRQRNTQDSFCLVLARVDHARSDSHHWDRPDLEGFMAELSDRFLKGLGEGAMGGRYSTNCLVFYLPGAGQDEGYARCQAVHRSCAKDLDAELVVGVAGYPCLGYSRADILDNCRKALDHAVHQPDIKLAGFGSVSLNINADRLFTHGDLYSAIDEYKTALLADPDNLLARNSLGICYARLGMLPQARKELLAVIDRSPGDLMAQYNFGFVCLKLDEKDVARSSFERCLELNPSHTYSLLRLGQMEEQEGNLEQARSLYLKASENPEQAGFSHSHLARVAIDLGDEEAASEHLHKALVHNPMDAHSLHLLADLYLRRGEDPEIAESLARKSTSLRPENERYWEVLAGTLEAQGRTEEAAAVRDKAGSA